MRPVTDMQIAEQPTDRGMLLPSPLAWHPIPARRRSPWNWLVGVVVVLVAAFIVMHLKTVPYVAYLPGTAPAVNGPAGAVTLDGKHVGSGDLFLVTIAEQTHITLWDRYTHQWFHPDWAIMPTAAVTGGATPAQFNQQNAQLMADSQMLAKVVALRRLGYSVPERGDGAAVLRIDPSAPATGKLQLGDVIVAVDGAPVRTSTDLGADIRAHATAPVTLDLKRPGKGELSVTIKPVPCGSACPGDEARPIVGVGVATDNESFDIPPSVHLGVTTQGIGGPSAGLAFTLGVLDAMTTHNLTGGHKVAATGEIDVSGAVLQIGGVHQKTIAVADAGCRYFVVPSAEAAEARSAARGRNLTIVPVDTLEQALTFLRSIGGDLSGIPSTPPQSAAG